MRTLVTIQIEMGTLKLQELENALAAIPGLKDYVVTQIEEVEEEE